MTKLLKLKLDGTIFTIVKQFGTGIILSTALVQVSILQVFEIDVLTLS